MRLDPEKKEIKELRSLIDLRNKEILEIGCGDGRITAMLKRKDNNILAIEPDKEQLKLARKKVSGVKFQVGTMSNLKTKKKFDLVIFSMSFHHVPVRSKKTVIKKAFSLLNQNGQILLIEPAIDGQVCEVVMTLVPAERKRIEAANKVIKELKILKKKSIELNWCYDDFESLSGFYEEMFCRKLTRGELDKIKKIVQVNSCPKEIILKDKINYFLIKDQDGKRNSNGIF